jgi:hypothetical protein
MRMKMTIMTTINHEYYTIPKNMKSCDKELRANSTPEGGFSRLLCIIAATACPTNYKR